MSAPSALPPAGLCSSCRHAELLRSARSTFLRCRVADRDPAFPRYPALPVVACTGYEPMPSPAPGPDAAVS